MNKTIMLMLILCLPSIVYGIIVHSGDVTITNNYNVTNNESAFVNIDGDVMTGNLNMSGNSLTDIGEIIMEGLIDSQDVIPITDGIYSIGNSTLWFQEAYIQNVYAQNINATEINSSDINTDTMQIDSNLTLGGHRIEKVGNDLVMVLT